MININIDYRDMPDSHRKAIMMVEHVNGIRWTNSRLKYDRIYISLSGIRVFLNTVYGPYNVDMPTSNIQALFWVIMSDI